MCVQGSPGKTKRPEEGGSSRWQGALGMPPTALGRPPRALEMSTMQGPSPERENFI